MKKYKAIKYFMIETEHIRLEINCNSVWDCLGNVNGYTVLHRKGVFVDVPQDTFERCFGEVKEVRNEKEEKRKQTRFDY